jgi:hypothetical protein
MGPADLLMADPYKEFYDASSNKKMDDTGLNDWLELQEQACMHDRQMKDLVVSHVEVLQQFVQAETSNGAWDAGIGTQQTSQKDGNKLPWTSLLS